MPDIYRQGGRTVYLKNYSLLLLISSFLVAIPTCKRLINAIGLFMCNSHDSIFQSKALI